MVDCRNIVLHFSLKLSRLRFTKLSQSVLPYLAIYCEFGYFWHHLANNSFSLATCTFWLLLKIWLKTGFKPVLNRFWLFLFCFDDWCRYFCLVKELWCRYFGFSQVLWCRSVGFFKNLATFLLILSGNTADYHYSGGNPTGTRPGNILNTIHQNKMRKIWIWIFLTFSFAENGF